MQTFGCMQDMVYYFLSLYYCFILSNDPYSFSIVSKERSIAEIKRHI